MKRIILVAVFAVFIHSPGYAQSNPCVPYTGIHVVNSGAPFTVLWLMDAQVPISTTNPNLVSQRIDGFYYQIDNGPRIKITPSAGTPCPDNPNKVPYSIRTNQGVSRGNHTLTLIPFNYRLDNGIPTTVEQEGAAAVIPFIGADQTHDSPPRMPENVIISK